jgi:hypothetical protein
MNKNRSVLIAGALLSIVLLGSIIWVIRSEGERTRQAIREARSEPIRAAEVTAEKIADQAERLIDRVARLPEQMAPAPRDDSSPEGTTSPEEAATELVGELFRAAQEVARPETDRDAASSPKSSPPQVGDMIGELFGLGRDLAKSGDEIGQDILGLSQEEEQQVGRELHKLIRQVALYWRSRPRLLDWRNWPNRCSNSANAAARATGFWFWT